MKSEDLKLRSILQSVVLLALCAALVCALAGCGGSSEQPKKVGEVAEEEKEPEPTEQPAEEKETALFEDDYISASYIDAYEVDGVEGVFYLQLSVENKSDKEVVVALTSSSVNNVSTQAMSGAPMVIQPGKESLNAFIFSYSTLNISSVDELEDISFKFTVFENATMSTLEETEVVSITF